MFTATAEPVVGVVDAVRAVLVADPVLLAGATNVRALVGVYGHLSEAARVAYPYLVLGRRTADGNEGAMQRSGSQVTLQIDGWSDAKGPYEIERIGSRVFALLDRRQGFSVPGFEVLDGSLHREFSEYFDEPDEDKPGARLYRMVQRWTVIVHEAL